MIPFQDRANFDDPEEHAAWLFIGLRMASGDTLNFHPDDAKAASRQLWEAGYRHHPELQTHRMSIPGGSAQSFLAASGGDWVPVGEPVEPVAQARAEVPDISDLSLEQRTALAEQLRDLGHGGPWVPPKVEGATVAELPASSDAIVGEAE